MGRHFKPSVSERKSKRKQRKQSASHHPKKGPKLSVWVFRGKPKPTDTNQTYIVSLDRKVDPDVFHERLNRLIPDTIVKADNPGAPQTHFIVILSKPITLREIYSKTSHALEGLI